MVDPSELLAVARLLAAKDASTPSDAQLRRAISTAYYAVFHAVLQFAADRLIGQGERAQAGYALIYRGYAHTQMKNICEDIDRPMLSEKYRRTLKRNMVPQEIRQFANSFVKLQKQRYAADYDPQALILQTNAIDVCDIAEVAIQSIASAPEPDRMDFLALLLVNVRG